MEPLAKQKLKNSPSMLSLDDLICNLIMKVNLRKASRNFQMRTVARDLEGLAEGCSL